MSNTGNYLKISGIRYIMEGLKQNEALKELNIGCSHFLSFSLFRGLFLLTFFFFLDNVIEDNGCAAIGEALEANSSLTKLNLN